ncbi:MAG TPA: glycosyltransferase family 39 protein [Gaiellaceae bacterium]|nr:glycosyltransferase family 39 protein [Gaiellaceae bacterium]
MRLADRARPLGSRLRSLNLPTWLGPFRREPWIVLGPLVLVQWLALLALTLTVRHNSWLYYQGGDQTFYYTTGWMFSHWRMPTAEVGWGWSYVLAPIAAPAGNVVLSGLPEIVLLNTLVLLPAALLGMYGIGARIGGRVFGYWTAAIWIAVPYVAIPLFVQRYHGKYVEQTLPQTFGLTPLADFPSMVLLILAAYLVLRALDTRNWREAVLSGLVVGFAFAVKPSNVIFFAAPAATFVVARRWRQLVAFGATLLPGVLLIALWKQRGLGTQPLFAEGGSGTGTLAALGIPLPLAGGLGRYVNIDWHHLQQNKDELREFFWAIRPLQWLGIAGVLALIRRGWARAALVSVWFYAFLVVKGSSDQARVEDASFFRLLMPSFPAFVLLLAAVPLLAPRLGPAIAARFPPGLARPRRLERPIVAVAVLTVVIPVILLATVRTQESQRTVKNDAQHTLVPVSGAFDLTGRTANGAASLEWRAPYSGSVGAFYVVLRSPRKFPDPTNPDERKVKEGVSCRERVGGASKDCHLFMQRVAATRALTWVDRPPKGDWTYRIGLAANWLDDPTRGDVLLVSPPIDVTLG